MRILWKQLLGVHVQLNKLKMILKVKKTNTIQWDDTLSAISGVTNISVEKLQSIDGITDANLIYAGNTMHFASSTSTVTTPQNEVVEKTVVTPSEKVDSKKEVGTPVDQSQTQTTITNDNQVANSNSNYQATTTPSV